MLLAKNTIEFEQAVGFFIHFIGTVNQMSAVALVTHIEVLQFKSQPFPVTMLTHWGHATLGPCQHVQ